MKIRRTTTDDLSHLADLWQEQLVTITKVDPRFSDSQPGRNTWLAQATVHQQSSTHRMVVAETDAQELAGYIAGHIQVVETVRFGVVDEIALDTHTYHGGLARQLYAALQTWFSEHGAEEIVIRVPRCYAVAQAFWRGLGAQEWLVEEPGEVWVLPPRHTWMRF